MDVAPSTFYCLCVFAVYGLGLLGLFSCLDTAEEVAQCTKKALRQLHKLANFI